MTTQTNLTGTALLLLCILVNETGFTQSWSQTGNAGTDHSVNFIGTTDNKGLRIRTNNFVRINISSNGKVGIGSSTPTFKFDVKGGSINTDSGYRINGTFILFNHGTNNIFTGNEAGANNSEGYQNSFFGSNAGNANSVGNNNTATGYKALYANTGGGANTATGGHALSSNINGYGNTANGFYALQASKSDFNTAFGYQALTHNSTGSYNTAIGTSALFANTIGFGNTASGYSALQNNTSSNNTAAGVQALYNNTSGAGNVALGYSALYNNTIGSNNTVIGSYSGPGTGAFSNSTALGYATFITASNQVRIGNSSVNSIGGIVNWTSLSDGRVKKNIKEDVPGLAFIKVLRPVTYTLDVTLLETHFHKTGGKKDNDNELLDQASDENKKLIAEKEKIIYSGFIAQDVEKVSKQLGYDFSGIDAPKNDEDVYGLRYAEFVIPLVKAVQELSAANDELQSRLNKIEQLLAHNLPIQPKVAVKSDSRLDQNSPNPFHQNSSIKYFVPQNVSNAFINITGLNGQVLRTIPIISKGEGQVNLQAGKLIPGTYQYSLIVDGKVIETKKMIVL